MHPGVAQTIRATTDSAMRDAADHTLADVWTTIAGQALQLEGTEEEAGQMIVQAGLRAAPYLIRLRAWDTALAVLQQSLRRERSPATRAESCRS